jgi:hypothetical protein
MLSLKRLRDEFTVALSMRMSGKPLNVDQEQWFELGLRCLMTPPEPKEDAVMQTIKIQVK